MIRRDSSTSSQEKPPKKARRKSTQKKSDEIEELKNLVFQLQEQIKSLQECTEQSCAEKETICSVPTSSGKLLTEATIPSPKSPQISSTVSEFTLSLGNSSKSTITTADSSAATPSSFVNPIPIALPDVSSGYKSCACCVGKICRCDGHTLQESPLQSAASFSEWDCFCPEFFSQTQVGPCQSALNADELSNQLWNPDWAPNPDSNPAILGVDAPKGEELIAIEHAQSLLKMLGSHLKIKNNLYAEVACYKGAITFVSPEFLELFRARSKEELIGRGISDLIPPGLGQFMEYIIHREMLASGNSSMTFGILMARMDGTVFKCITNWSMMLDAQNSTNMQDIIGIHLDSVEDLPHVAPVETPLPIRKPKISLELDYPESPNPCSEKSKQQQECS
eukprot:TRINITY_DN6674_c0_g1_i1.p1 TRINITY_DN6674_c0_g1~~TRINITY_DN6674_c0_g1_i1.p1  ORF type:complete len:393 (-),score=94.16 TRINITY_DN6674_c0_g1_i1:23-1201(-)